MASKSAKSRTKAEFKHSLPVTVSRPSFKVSSSLALIDAAKLTKKAQIEVEVGTFTGDGCGNTVSAVVKHGKVVGLKVSPCAETTPMRVDAPLKSLAIAARKKLGLRGTPPKFRPMPFAAFQASPNEIVVTTITCFQICVFGHCWVCCTTPFDDLMCGDRLIIHKD